MYTLVRDGDQYPGGFGDVASVLVPCTWSSNPVDCLWRGIWAEIENRPEVEATLLAITTTGCSDALRSLGLDPSSASTICALGGSVWTEVQRRAAAKLRQLAWNRGRDRSAAEGGGHTLVDARGQVVGVVCPWVEPIYDASGTVVVGYSAGHEKIVGPNERCPAPPRLGEFAPVPRPTQIARQAATARVTGRVVDRSGSPVAGAEVRVGSEANPVAGRTDASGRFDVQVTPAARVPIYVRSGDYSGRKEAASVAAGAVVDVGDVVVERVLKSEQEGAAPRPWYKSPVVIAGGLLIIGAGAYFLYRARGR